MAVLSGATASGRQMYQGQPTTTNSTLYTAPTNNANVTSPSATAYVKEIIICNTTATAASISIYVGGGGITNRIISEISVAGNDTKFLSGLNIMIPAGAIIAGYQDTAASLTVTISGVEVQ
jgi:hypothetical protein